MDGTNGAAEVKPNLDFFLGTGSVANFSTSAPSNCILIFECLDEPFSYGSCNLCIGVIAIPRASYRRRRSDFSVALIPFLVTHPMFLLVNAFELAYINDTVWFHDGRF
jgi:hypothetical protein